MIVYVVMARLPGNISEAKEFVWGLYLDGEVAKDIADQLNAYRKSRPRYPSLIGITKRNEQGDKLEKYKQEVHVWERAGPAPHRYGMAVLWRHFPMEVVT